VAANPLFLATKAQGHKEAQSQQNKIWMFFIEADFLVSPEMVVAQRLTVGKLLKNEFV
jgi:hypothetical protein